MNFSEKQAKHFTDSEWLHYASLGFIDGIPAERVDALVHKQLTLGEGLAQARLDLQRAQEEKESVSKQLTEVLNRYASLNFNYAE